MAARARRTRAAETDYNEIWDYIGRRDVAAADRLVDRLDAAIVGLARHPHIGNSAAHYSANLRSFPVGNFLIYYWPEEEGVLVIRILHGARKITPDFFRRS